MVRSSRFAPPARSLVGKEITLPPTPVARTRPRGPVRQVSQLARATTDSGERSVYEEPMACYARPEEIDRAEALLKASLEQQPVFLRNTVDPVEAMTKTLLAEFDLDLNETLSPADFRRMFRKLRLEKGVDRKAVDGLFARLDLDHSGSVDPAEMAARFFASGEQAVAESTIARLRECLSRRSGGFLGLAKQFRLIDRDRSQSIDFEEFTIGLTRLAHDVFPRGFTGLTEAQQIAVFNYFDKDMSGRLLENEFIRGVRGDMSKKRRELVKEVFLWLDKDRSGQLDVDDIREAYHVDAASQVRSGRMSGEEAVQHFMDLFDTDRSGQVSPEEFIEVYNWTSAEIDSDEYFATMIGNAWHLPGSGANLRVRVTFNGGRPPSKVVALEDDFGLSKPYDAAEIKRRLAQQGVRNVATVDVSGRV